MDALHHIGAALVLLGTGVCLIGTLGLIRFRDVYARSHATSLTDTFAAGIMVLGMACLTTSWVVGLKLAMLFAFLLLSTPTGTHALVQAALRDDVKPQAEQA